MSFTLATILSGPKEIPFWDFTDKEFFTKLEGLVARDSAGISRASQLNKRSKTLQASTEVAAH